MTHSWACVKTLACVLLCNELGMNSCIAGFDKSTLLMIDFVMSTRLKIIERHETRAVMCIFRKCALVDMESAEERLDLNVLG